MDRTGMYLRKSRLDIEMERKLGIKDTLANHRKDLLKFAKAKGMNIVDVYEEVESGDSIIHRPEMLRLLRDVEAGKLDGVLVMDMDRLGRGDLQDQGLILNTFKNSNTLIITPDKTYDLNNEIDEDYAEFKSLVSRKEYKLITKRLKAGVRRFVEDGNYIPPIAPYGYKIVRTDRERTLEIVPEQAEVIRLIYDMYLNGTGIIQISRELNSMGYKSYYGDKIERTWVSRVLRNPIYAGYIIWSRKEIKKSSEPGKKRVSKTRPVDKHLISKGKHEAIVSKEIFDAVQKKLLEDHPAPVKSTVEIANPLAGILKCKVCGAAMARVYNRQINGKYLESLVCKKFCGNRGITMKYVEEGLIDYIRNWLEEYKREWHEYKKLQSNNQTEILNKKVTAAKRELSGLIKQKDNLHNLVEKGVYDINTYLERSKVLADAIENARISLIKAETELNNYKEKISSNIEIIPKAESLLEKYWLLSIAERNRQLKSILNKVEYYKSKDWYGNRFELTLYPKI